MTPEEAIEINRRIKEVHRKLALADDVEAIQLGIEALKRIKARRDLRTGWEIQLLPGETNEKIICPRSTPRAIY